MAKTNYRGYLRDDRVPIKKYFYVLRPLLSIMWLEKYGEPAPIEFELQRLESFSDSPEKRGQIMRDLNSLFQETLSELVRVQLLGEVHFGGCLEIQTSGKTDFVA